MRTGSSIPVYCRPRSQGVQEATTMTTTKARPAALQPQSNRRVISSLPSPHVRPSTVEPFNVNPSYRRSPHIPVKRISALVQSIPYDCTFSSPCSSSLPNNHRQNTHTHTGTPKHTHRHTPHHLLAAVCPLSHHIHHRVTYPKKKKTHTRTHARTPVPQETAAHALSILRNKRRSGGKTKRREENHKRGRKKGGSRLPTCRLLFISQSVAA